MSKRMILFICTGSLAVIVAILWAWRSTDETGPAAARPTTTHPQQTAAATPATGTGDSAVAGPNGRPVVTPVPSRSDLPLTSQTEPMPQTMGSFRNTATPRHRATGIGPSAAVNSMSVRAWHPGADAVAAVTTADGQTVSGLLPNQVNAFPRVSLQPKEQVQVTVSYPKGAAGAPVVVQVEDGGWVDGTYAEAVTLDQHHTAHFQFAAGDNAGLYQVVLRAQGGADVKTLRFWVNR